MHPIRYIKDNTGKICFYYDKSEYKNWYKNNGGTILVSIEGSLLTYFMMSNTERFTITYVNNPFFDGEIPEPEYFLKDAAIKRLEDWFSRLKVSYLIPHK